MKKTITFIALSLLIMACSSDDDTNTTAPDVVTEAQVLSNYATIVHQSYLDSYTAALELQTAVNTFLASPSAATFDAAKIAWLAAREPYGQTEAYRFANGPIDAEGTAPWVIGNEGQLNAWPLEEALIDYVLLGSEAQGAGIFDFNIVSSDRTIDAASIISLNEFEGNEAAISTGWHAIEFLLWGQDNSDPADATAGLREFTDYTTLENANRRAQYLRTATNLLVNDLNDLVVTWANGGLYRTEFESLEPSVALRQIITGPFTMAGDELSSERMIAPVDSEGGLNGWGQEDEHSCFSDNTHRDIFTNAQGVDNVIFGRYGTITGPSFYDLVQQENPEQAEALLAASENARALVAAVANNTQPFDFLILQESSQDTNRGVVLQAADALITYGDVISASATAIGINLQ